ncbi:UDP-N-acetylmuramoyl-tripeptide--D-alanyl-D-alanine ligase [Halomonas sp. AOP35-4E-18]|uniref:UDP-N-acetylmuramoyl-tripeptide--D-alanyl-D- alanine ligase n=1 Tax=Halomonas sp. AOP35-4E-18 TaxID=3457686 RepID=UPI0040333CF9
MISMSFKVLSDITNGEWSNVEDFNVNSVVIEYVHSNEYDIDIGALVVPRGMPTFKFGTARNIIKKFNNHVAAFLVDDTFDVANVHQPALVVKNVSHALSALAKYSRAQFCGSIVAVTGSVGKTSTKEMLNHILSEHGSVFYEAGTGNITPAISRQLINLKKEDYALLEISSAALPASSHVAAPYVAILTSIAPAHLSDLGSVSNVAKRKSTIFEGLSNNGWAVINRDIPYFDVVVKHAYKFTNNVLTYGEHELSDMRLVDYNQRDQSVAVSYDNNVFSYKLAAQGKHFAINSMACLLTASLLNMPLVEASSFLFNFFPGKRRGNLINISVKGGNASLIDESYNANPVSMAAALESFSNIEISSEVGRKIIVLADMASLGKDERQYHEKLLTHVFESGANKVFLLGQNMKFLWEILPEPMKGGHFFSIDDLCSEVSLELLPNDIVMVKGSNSMRLNKFISFFTN